MAFSESAFLNNNFTINKKTNNKTSLATDITMLASIPALAEITDLIL